MEIELHPTRHLVSVPLFEILAVLDAHAVGQVGILGWQGPYVVLVGPGVEEVGEIPFLQFGQAKGLGKGRQRHLKKGQGVDEAECLPPSVARSWPHSGSVPTPASVGGIPPPGGSYHSPENCGPAPSGDVRSLLLGSPTTW